jgi:hypothetical protein
MKSIDAVISWVDGYDPTFQQKLKNYCVSQGLTQNQVIEPTRIQQCDEITYCLYSLSRFAPWLRTIYIITNQQTPPIVTELQGTALGNKIVIVDQNELLKKLNISTPVFNSIGVEWLIWQIEGLSDQFIYLNDDFFILREVTPEDFFRNNKMVLRGHWKIQAERKYGHRVRNFIARCMGKQKLDLKIDIHRHFQEESARIANCSHRYYLLPHAPFPLIKQQFVQRIGLNSQLMYDSLRHPFRHREQVSSIPLLVHFSIKDNQTLYESPNSVIMINGACHSFLKIKKRLDRANTDSKIAFLCVQSLDQASQEIQKYIHEWLQKKIIEIRTNKV